MKAIRVSLAGEWRVGASREEDPEGLLDHLRIQVGEHAVTAHIDPVPVLQVVTQLAHAVADVLDGSRQTTTVTIGREQLHLRAAPGGLRLTIGDGEREVLVDAPVDGATLRESLLAEAAGLVDALPAAATAPLADATLRLACLDRPREDTLPPRPTSPQAVVPAGRGRVAFGVRSTSGDGSRLEVRLGEHVLVVGRAPLGELVEGLAGAVEATLQTRDWPDGVVCHGLDGRAERRLQVTREESQSWLSVTDRGGHVLCPPVPVTPLELAESVCRFLERARRHPRWADDSDVAMAARAARDLSRWARELAEGDRFSDAPPPEGWQAFAEPGAAPVTDPLPVAGLHHLAYRRGWRREAPGLQRVDADAERLLVFCDDRVEAVGREDGRTRWTLADVQPLGSSSPGFAVAEGALVRFDPATGDVVWRAARHGVDAPLRSARLSRDRVLAGTTDGALLGLDAATGRLRWRYRTAHGAVLEVALHGPLAWITAEDGFLHGVRLADGGDRFRVQLYSEPEGPPLLTPAGLLVGAHRTPADAAQVTLHDPLSGRVRWTRPLDAPLGRPVELHGGALYAVTDDCAEAAVLRIELDTGEVAWSHVLPAGTEAPVARATDTHLFVKSADGAVTTLDPASGDVLWAVGGDDPEQWLRENAPPVATRGVLLVPGTRVRVLDPETGRVVQALDCAELIPGWLHAWPDGDIAIAEDDAVAHYLLGGHLALVG